MLGPAVAWAGPDPLAGLRPTANDVRGLRVVGESRYAGAGEALTELYDGGYMRYVNAGVVGASQGYYNLKDGTVELTLHRMESPEAAMRFLGSLCNDINANVAPLRGRPGGRVCTGASAGTFFGYLALADVLVATSLDQGDAADLDSVLQATARRIARAPASKPAKPTQKR